MANNIIQIKRSTGNSTPGSLNPGELAYSYVSNTLYIGNTTNGPVIIGGQVYMQYLASITPGTLSASRAIVVDTNSLIDKIFVGNTTSNTTANTTGVTIVNAANTTTILPGSVKVANGTSNVTIVIPTAAQYTGGNFFLNANGSWTTVTGGTAAPGGANTQVQFNDSNTLNGSAGFTFNNTTNTVFVANTVAVGANVFLNTQSLSIGNATVNTTYNQTTLTFANSTTTSTYDTTATRHGITAANVVVNATSVVVQSNATTNAVLLNTGLTMANGATTTVFDPSGVKAGATAANVVISTTNVLLQSNTTVNTNISATSIVSANALGTATLNPVSLVIGASTIGNVSIVTTTANATAVNVGANVNLTTTSINVGNATVNTNMTSTTTTIRDATNATTANTTAILVGNATINATVTATQITSANSTATTTITPTSITVRDITVSGNLVVNGTAVTLNVATVNVQDSMIRLANNNLTTDTIDIGMYGSFGNSTVTQYTGLTRKASDAKWYLWANTTTEPNTSIANTTNLATLVLNSLQLTTALDPAYGGTGKTAFTGNAVVTTSNTTNLTFLSFGTDGQVLQMNGTALAFGALDGGTF